MLLREELTVLFFCPCYRLHAELLLRQAHLTGRNQTVRPAPIKPMPKMTPEMTKRMSKPLTTNPRIPTRLYILHMLANLSPYHCSLRKSGFFSLLKVYCHSSIRVMRPKEDEKV